MEICNDTVRSKLDYAIFGHEPAKQGTIRQLKPVHYKDIRLCAGAFRTSPVESLNISAHNSPLYLRRELVGLGYAARVSISKDNPAHSHVVSTSFTELFARHPSIAQPFVIHIKPAFSVAQFSLSHVASLRPTLPSWYDPVITCDLQLSACQKPCTAPVVFQQGVAKILKKVEGYRIFTMMNQKHIVLFGLFLWLVTSQRHSCCPLASVFTSELYALVASLTHTRKLHIKKSVMCSDSLSAPMSLRALVHKKHIILGDIHTLVKEIQSKGRTIHFL